MRARGSAVLSCASTRRHLVVVATPTEAAAARATVPFNTSRRLSGVDVIAYSSLFGLLVLMPVGPSTVLSLWRPAAWLSPTIKVKTIIGHDSVRASSRAELLSSRGPTRFGPSLTANATDRRSHDAAPGYPHDR